MPPVTLQNDHWRVELTPEHGASVVNAAAWIGGQWTPILRPAPADAVAAGNVSGMASFTLAPFSNRLPDARFTFNRRLYQLRPNTPEGYAQHGDVRRRPWQPQSVDALSAAFTLETRTFPDFNYPFPFTAAIRYALDGAAFDTHLRLTNVGDTDMPAGFGFHPYFNRALGAANEAFTLQASATGVYPELVPTTPAIAVPPALDFSRSRPLADAPLNHCFAGWDGRAEIHWPAAGATLTLTAEALLRHLILFAPPGERFFAVEPVTHATNGFNLYAAGYPDTGTLVLAPGGVAEAGFRMTFSRTA